MSKIIKMLPCPFCGGQAYFGEYQAYSTDSSFNAVVCDQCSVYMEQVTFQTQEELAKVWNSRATPVASNEESQ